MRTKGAHTLSGAAARTGLTLIELMLVMTLIALLFGFGFGTLGNLDFGGRGAVSLVRSTLRSANNWAIAREAPAVVRFDLEQGTIAAAGVQVVGTWHFEQRPPRGAFELDGMLHDAELDDEGYIGKALSFNVGLPDARYVVPVQADPAFDFTAGFLLQCVLRPEGAGGGRLINISDVVGVEVTARGGIKAWFATQRRDEFGVPKPAGKALVSTRDGLLRDGRWNKLLVSYDGRILAIYLDGLLAASLEDGAEVQPVTKEMVLGGGERPWRGSIDNLVVSSLGEAELQRLPEDCRFAPDTPEEIRFQAGGGLDQDLHPEPLDVVVEFADGRGFPIHVGLYGTVE